MASTADFRNGMIIVFDDILYIIVEFQHVKPGKGGAFVRTRLKRLDTGSVIDRTFRAGERVDEARVERTSMQFLYILEDTYYFMDTSTYEQIALSQGLIGDSKRFIKENMVVEVLMWNGKAIGLELPNFVELTVTSTDPGVRGDTASGGTKPAVLETGLTVQVPLFIEEGDVLKVNTRTGDYIERA